MNFLYDVARPFSENIKQGPVFNGNIPKRFMPPVELWVDFFEYKITSRLGVAACPLGTSKGIALMSKLGYDVLMYKTVRSYFSAPYDLPNICHVSVDGYLTQDKIGASLLGHAKPFNTSDMPGISNSFGNACFDLEFMLADIERSKKTIKPGQVLGVSVYGTEHKKRSLFQDFLYTAQAVIDAGAQFVELNLSCPNIIGEMDFLYKDAQAVAQLVSFIAKQIVVPLVIKVGIFDSQQQLEEVVCAAARAGARGVAGINTVPMQVVNQQGQPFFGQARKISGVSGKPIWLLAQDFVRQVRQCIDQNNLELSILGSGGITEWQQFDKLLDCGADVAMSATGAMCNAYLAAEYHAHTTVVPVEKRETQSTI